MLNLARSAVETFAREHRTIEAVPASLAALAAPRAAFVSIHTRDGALRGCIGTTAPVQTSLALEIVRNAIAAANDDPRFEPVAISELPNLVYKVDVLSDPEPARSAADLDPKRYGVIVRQGARTGLLLPDLPEVQSVDDQIWIASMKAGITPSQDVELLRFTVERFEENK